MEENFQKKKWNTTKGCDKIMKSPKLATLVGSEYNKEDIPHTTELPINFLLNDRKIMEKKTKIPRE